MIGRLILVRGKVQGVFYRASTVDIARKLGVTGYVKNLENGDVAIEVFGMHEDVEALVNWANIGSEFSKVKEVKAVEIPFREMKGFNVVYD